MIDGKTPDFVNINGKKILIEYNGFYTHTTEKDKAKAEHYAQYGWKTINIERTDLNEDMIVKIIRENNE